MEKVSGGSGATSANFFYSCAIFWFLHPLFKSFWIFLYNFLQFCSFLHDFELILHILCVLIFQAGRPVLFCKLFPSLPMRHSDWPLRLIFCFFSVAHLMSQGSKKALKEAEAVKKGQK